MKVFQQIVDLLNNGNVTFRVIEHPPEGRTDVASKLRGHCLSQAAKAMVVEIKGMDGELRYALAVVPGHRRVALKRLAQLMGGRKARFAPPDVAVKLTGCVMGSVPPVSFDERLSPVVDHSLTEVEEIVFNAGRLDRSIVLNTHAFIRLVKPRLDAIVE